MKRILPFILPVLLSCNQNPQKSVTEKIPSNTIDSAEPDKYKVDTIQKTTIEYLDWNSLKLNNKLPILCKKSELIKLLGQPDSTVVPNKYDICGSYFNSDIEFMYFGKSFFEASGDSIIVSSIRLDSNKRIILTTGNLVLDNSMTLDKFATQFPNAFKLKEEVILDKEGKVLSVRLEASKAGTDDAWILFFKDGKLIGIDYFSPC
jgi:hypothetical protein